MKLSEILREQRILVDVKARDKGEVLDALIAPVVNGIDRSTILAALLEREELGSTGIGRGVAVPHVRLDGVQAPAVVFARSQRPVDFGAMDGTDCSLFFLVVGPKDPAAQESYLQVMAKVSRLMRDAAVRATLLKAATPADVMAAIRAMEA